MRGIRRQLDRPSFKKFELERKESGPKASEPTRVKEAPGDSGHPQIKRPYQKGGRERLGKINGLLHSYMEEMVHTEEKDREAFYKRLANLEEVQAAGVGRLEIVSWFKRSRKKMKCDEKSVTEGAKYKAVKEKIKVKYKGLQFCGGNLSGLFQPHQQSLRSTSPPGYFESQFDILNQSPSCEPLPPGYKPTDNGRRRSFAFLDPLEMARVPGMPDCVRICVAAPLPFALLPTLPLAPTTLSASTNGDGRIHSVMIPGDLLGRISPLAPDLFSESIIAPIVETSELAHAPSNGSLLGLASDLLQEPVSLRVNPSTSVGSGLARPLQGWLSLDRMYPPLSSSQLNSQRDDLGCEQQSVEYLFDDLPPEELKRSASELEDLACFLHE
jgi:hypothetical protein